MSIENITCLGQFNKLNKTIDKHVLHHRITVFSQTFSSSGPQQQDFFSLDHKMIFPTIKVSTVHISVPFLTKMFWGNLITLKNLSSSYGQYLPVLDAL